MYDPRLEDSDSHLVSQNADPVKREGLLKYIRELIAHYDIGEPCETVNMSFKKLKENNIVGLYYNSTTKDISAIKLFGDFTAVPPPPPTEEELAAKPKYQMNFRRRPKQMYKRTNLDFDKQEVLTIDDYVPPTPTKD